MSERILMLQEEIAPLHREIGVLTKERNDLNQVHACSSSCMQQPLLSIIQPLHCKRRTEQAEEFAYEMAYFLRLKLVVDTKQS